MREAFRELFRRATGFAPYPYQERLALEPWPELLHAPTGLGKTAAVSLAWLFKRGWRAGGKAEPEKDTPRRLVWCLPMRALAEQTKAAASTFLHRLGVLGEAGEGKVSVHLLMGGEPDLKSWAEHPEEDMILIGTQDMLLSRALMRGYGMSRYQWPVHFALLHNDALWALDEVQLMGNGLATACQLEALRRKLGTLLPARTLWISATLHRDWLATVDLRPHLDGMRTLAPDEDDKARARRLFSARKSLAKADVSLVRTTKGEQKRYLDALAEFVLAQHVEGTTTIVIANRVARAQEIFARIQKARGALHDLLLHSRFRPAERAELARRLKEEQDKDRIIVATQAIEAGVDVSSRTLITELAPFSSLVQRFGRCNRYGEHEDARVFWVDIADEAGADGARPYDPKALARARARLEALDEAGLDALGEVDEPPPWSRVLRRKDLVELFDTDPDLSGFDVDVSPWVRGEGMPELAVFWRDFRDNPNGPEPEPLPAREELCPASIGQARELFKVFRERGHALWRWDALAARWEKLSREEELRPGLVLLAPAEAGGYDARLGLAPTSRAPVPVVAAALSAHESYGSDWRSHAGAPVPLDAHLADARKEAERLCMALGIAHTNLDGIGVLGEVVPRAARWHDVGKAHPVFQAFLHGMEAKAAEEADKEGRLVALVQGKPLLAKAGEGAAREKARPHFRHELASMLAWLAVHDDPKRPDAKVDLIAWLVLAHHGKVRMRLRALPGESSPSEEGRRFARGVWEGDTLPGFAFDGERISALSLSLEIMELGLGKQGRSWSERAQELLARLGPFRLAMLEALVRLADWRASARTGGQGASGVR